MARARNRRGLPPHVLGTLHRHKNGTSELRVRKCGAGVGKVLSDEVLSVGKGCSVSGI